LRQSWLQLIVLIQGMGAGLRLLRAALLQNLILKLKQQYYH
jgi:hypothetical protein